MSYKSGVVRLVVSHAQAHSYKAAFPKRNAILNDATAAYKASRTNAYTAIKDGASRDMTVVFDYSVVLNQCTRIDDAVFTDPGTGINDSAVHHDGACANACVTGDMGGWRDDVRQAKAKLDGSLIEADARVW